MFKFHNKSIPQVFCLQRLRCCFESKSTHKNFPKAALFQTKSVGSNLEYRSQEKPFFKILH